MLLPPRRRPTATTAATRTPTASTSTATVGAAPHLRLRPALLPRRRAGPPRGPGGPRRGAPALPGVGRRLGPAPSSRPTSTVRGWETLPVARPVTGGHRRRQRRAAGTTARCASSGRPRRAIGSSRPGCELLSGVVDPRLARPHHAGGGRAGRGERADRLPPLHQRARPAGRGHAPPRAAGRHRPRRAAARGHRRRGRRGSSRPSPPTRSSRARRSTRPSPPPASASGRRCSGRWPRTTEAWTDGRARRGGRDVRRALGRGGLRAAGGRLGPRPRRGDRAASPG